MTALGWRRQQNLRAAGAIGAVAALFMGLAIAVGVSALANSDAGRDVTGGAVPDRVRLPFTATAAIGVTDDEGELVAVALMVLRPEGVGGSVVVVPAEAVLALEAGIEDVQPVSPAEAWRRGGVDALAARLEAMTAVSIDWIGVVQGARIEQDLPEVLQVDAPVRWSPPAAMAASTLVALVDSDIVGPSVLPGVERPLEARAVPDLVGWNAPDPAERAPLRVSVWRALIDAGSGSADPGADPPRDLREFLGALRAGPVGLWALATTDLRLGDDSEGDAPRTVEAVDRAEVLLVLGQIAPGRLAAPNSSSRFRVVSVFDAEQLGALASAGAPAGVERTNAQIAHRLIADLLFLDGNVVSVLASDPPPPGLRAPEVTRVEVADAGVRAVVAEQWARVFGEFEVVVADTPIDGVDATIVLGMSSLRDEGVSR